MPASLCITAVGWVERSETHQIRRRPKRWVSLRSTHPTDYAAPLLRSAKLTSPKSDLALVVSEDFYSQADLPICRSRHGAYSEKQVLSLIAGYEHCLWTAVAQARRTYRC